MSKSPNRTKYYRTVKKIDTQQRIYFNDTEIEANRLKPGDILEVLYRPMRKKTITTNPG